LDVIGGIAPIGRTAGVAALERIPERRNADGG
jgi:hypothetical protein